MGCIEAPPHQVYLVLTDFERYHEFMPNITAAEILEQAPGEALVNYVLGLPLGKSKKYRLRLK